MLPEHLRAVTIRNADPFPEEVIAAAKAHAIRVYPQESCGLIVEAGYVECENVHIDPLNWFEIDARIMAKYMKKGPILAVVHSHPEGPNFPSVSDQQGQIQSGLTWGIVPVIGTNEGDDIVPVASDIVWWGDALPIAPLERRRFVWGIFHCYALWRDWVRLEWGVTPPNFPCSPDFVEEGYSIFVDNCEQAGLRNLGKIEMSELEVGDMLVGHVKGAFPNHCGVYLGGDDFMHHQPNKISGKDNLLRWWPFIDTVMRYDR